MSWFPMPGARPGPLDQRMERCCRLTVGEHTIHRGGPGFPNNEVKENLPMECRSPDTIREDDLLIFALNPEELSAEARQHLKECLACAERAAAYQRFSHTLTTRLYRWDCPPTQEISDFAAGWLTGKQRRAVSMHLRRCPRCTEEFELSRQFLAPAPLPAPERWHEPVASPVAARPRLIAQLLSRRITEGALLGLRGESSAGWPRQYQVGDISLSLHRATASAGGTGAMLLGLISRAQTPPDAFVGTEVRLFPPSAEEQTPVTVEQIDDLGNFILSPPPAGRFDLLIVLPEGDLVIEGLELDD